MQVCVQLGDAVPFRLHWPRGVDLRANNMMYRPYGRNPAHKLGNNARDEPASIGAHGTFLGAPHNRQYNKLHHGWLVDVVSLHRTLGCLSLALQQVANLHLMAACRQLTPETSSFALHTPHLQC